MGTGGLLSSFILYTEVYLLKKSGNLEGMLRELLHITIGEVEYWVKEPADLIAPE